MNALFVINSILLGVGLAMDAFSVSMANGLNEPHMNGARVGMIAGVYAFFQFLMPMVGWICVHTVVEYFTAFQAFIPYIALILLLYIGIGMIREALGPHDDDSSEVKKLGFGTLFVQGVATSIDALSVGFTIAEYNLAMALTASIIIAAVTFIICWAGVEIGKRFGTKLSGKASILGGVILIGIGIEIFIKGVFF